MSIQRTAPKPSPFASISKSPAGAAATRRSEDVEPDDDLEDEEGDDEETKARKRAKRAKKAEEDDKKDDDDAKCRAARQRERERCAAIFAAPEAAHNIVATCHVAFMTSMPRDKAIETLAALHASGGMPTDAEASTALATSIVAADRRAQGVGIERKTAKRPVDTMAAAIVAAGKKARGE